jgi:hypothetical protein
MNSVLDEPDLTTAATPGRDLTSRPPLLLSAILLAIFIPEEFSFELFGLRLTIARVILLLLVPLVLIAYGRLISSGRYRFVLSDLLMPLTGLWMIAAPATVDGLPQALVKGGVMALDFMVAYAAMRAIPQKRHETFALLKILCASLAIVGYLSILDPITGGPLLHELATDIWGYRIDYAVEYSHEHYLRFGLFRASGPFEHPILLGIVMVYGLVLARALQGRYRIFCGVGCAIGLAASFSSAPLLALMLVVAFAIYGRVVRFPYRWFVISALTIMVFTIFLLVHPAPFGWIFGHLLLDAQTGYFRLLIWQYAGDNVLASPILGLGMTDFWVSRPAWMPASVDSLWLVSAMTFGIPGSALIALSMVSACWSPVRRNDQNAELIGAGEERMAKSLGVIILLTIFLGFSVHIWGACWILLGLIAGLRANLGQLATGVAATHTEMAWLR